MSGARVAVLAAFCIFLTEAAWPQDPPPAVWAQGSDQTALKWSGAKGEVNGLVHSNGGIKVSGSKNEFTGGTHYVTSFDNPHSNGRNANVFDPVPQQVQPQALPIQYSLADYMPGGAAALAAGDNYVDLTSACSIGTPGDNDDEDDDDDSDSDSDEGGRHHHKKGGSGHHDDDYEDDDDDSDSDSDEGGKGEVSISFRNEDIPGRLYWAPCDVSFTAKNAVGQVTIVSTGKIHFKARKNSHVTAFADGFLALSASDKRKAIHLNGNTSTLHGYLLAEAGEVHLAGSKQSLSCGIFGDRIKVSGSSITIDGEDCGGGATNSPPMAVEDQAATLENTAVQIDLLANDSDGDGTLVPSSVTIVADPANGSVTVDAATGVATYTPALNFFGIDEFSYVVSDDDGATSQPALVTITVADTNDPPVAAADEFSTPEDTAIVVDVLQNDFDIDGILDPTTVTVIDAPASGTTVVDPDNGMITYTPEPDFFGDDTFTYTVQDDDGAVSQAANAQITVTAVNDPPVVQPDDVPATEDTAALLDVLSNDSDVDNVLTVDNIVLSVPPANGTISIDSAAGTATYTPNPNFFGNDSFEYSLVDAGGAPSAGSALVTITVDPVNDAPVANDASINVAEDNVLAIDLDATDVDGDAISYTIVDQPAIGTISGAAPSLMYTPPLNFFGTVTLTFTATDGTLESALATVTITVDPVNDLPVVMNQGFSTGEDVALDLTLDATDADGDALTFQVTVSPSNGSLSGSGPDFQYLPNENFNGSDSFTYVANDATGDSVPATVSIDVTATNDTPVADAQALSTAEDTGLPITLTGSDVDGDTLTFTVQDQPTNGNLSGAAPNLVYTPSPDFNGGDSFTFFTSDGLLNSSLAVVQITVTGTNDVPTAIGQDLATAEDTVLDIVLAGADVDGDTLSFTIDQAPANGVLSGAPPNVQYTPAADFNGADSFSFVANDGTVNSAPALVQIAVAPVNDRPLAADLNIATDEDFAVAVVLSGSDVDGDTLTYSVQQYRHYG